MRYGVIFFIFNDFTSILFCVYNHCCCFFFLKLDDAEYSIPHVDMMPSLESILSELDTDSDIISDVSVRITPTPSIDDRPKTGTMLRHVLLQGVTSQITSASVRN